MGSEMCIRDRCKLVLSALVILDFIFNTEFLKEPQDTLRARVVQVVLLDATHKDDHGSYVTRDYDCERAMRRCAHFSP